MDTRAGPQRGQALLLPDLAQPREPFAIAERRAAGAERPLRFLRREERTHPGDERMVRVDAVDGDRRHAGQLLEAPLALSEPSPGEPHHVRHRLGIVHLEEERLETRLEVPPKLTARRERRRAPRAR